MILSKVVNVTSVAAIMFILISTSFASAAEIEVSSSGKLRVAEVEGDNWQKTGVTVADALAQSDVWKQAYRHAGAGQDAQQD